MIFVLIGILKSNDSVIVGSILHRFYIAFFTVKERKQLGSLSIRFVVYIVSCVIRVIRRRLTTIVHLFFKLHASCIVNVGNENVSSNFSLKTTSPFSEAHFLCKILIISIEFLLFFKSTILPHYQSIQLPQDIVYSNSIIAPLSGNNSFLRKSNTKQLSPLNLISVGIPLLFKGNLFENLNLVVSN